MAPAARATSTSTGPFSRIESHPQFTIQFNWWNFVMEPVVRELRMTTTWRRLSNSCPIVRENDELWRIQMNIQVNRRTSISSCLAIPLIRCAQFFLLGPKTKSRQIQMPWSLEGSAESRLDVVAGNRGQLSLDTWFAYRSGKLQQKAELTTELRSWIFWKWHQISNATFRTLVQYILCNLNQIWSSSNRPRSP